MGGSAKQKVFYKMGESLLIICLIQGTSLNHQMHADPVKRGFVFHQDIAESIGKFSKDKI